MAAQRIIGAALARTIPDDGYSDGGTPYEEMNIIEGNPTPPLARDRADASGERVQDCFGQWHEPHRTSCRRVKSAKAAMIDCSVCGKAYDDQHESIPCPACSNWRPGRAEPSQSHHEGPDYSV